MEIWTSVGDVTREEGPAAPARADDTELHGCGPSSYVGQPDVGGARGGESSTCWSEAVDEDVRVRAVVQREYRGAVCAIGLGYFFVQGRDDWGTANEDG